jgi:tetratricopeptide (TPR) repeat protein
MIPLSQLVDQGVRAYVEGRLDDARRLLDEVLQRDPANARARSYLILLHDVPPTPRAAPAPMPAVAPNDPTPQVAMPLSVAIPGWREAPPWSPAPVEPAPAPIAPPLAAPVDVPVDGGYAPSPWDDGPAASSTIQIDDGGGLDLDAVAEKSDLRPLVPEAFRQPLAGPAPGAPAPWSAAPERAPLPPRRDVDVWMAASKDLHALGDFSGSLELIEKILRLDPEHAEARAYLQENEATLVAMYESKLGPLGSVPRLAIKPEEVMWLNLDHRAGFLLSQIDGAVDYESLFALSGLPRLDTARILATLIADGVIGS